MERITVEVEDCCNYCKADLEVGQIAIEHDERIYCSSQCVFDEIADYELERGLEREEARDRAADFRFYADGVF